MSTINQSIKIIALLLLSFAVCQSAFAVKPPHPHDPPAPPPDVDPHPGSDTWWVAALGGDDGESEDNSSCNPFATIQRAMAEAGPDDTIVLAAGDYYQDVITVRNGTDAAPIVITGPDDGVILGAGNPRIFEINHSYITLDGFSIDGLYDDANPGVMESYRDKLLFVLSKTALSGPTGLIISNMHFSNAGGECLRFRYFVNNSDIIGSEFYNCGVYDFQFADGGKNGEAIYIGTSSNDLKDGKNPTADLDKSNDNYIYGNTINVLGGECIDIKEGSERNLVEGNDCTGAVDIDSGAINVRGDSNIIYNNNIHDNDGAGVRLGGHKVRGHTYGVNNDVYENEIKGNALGGIKFMVTPQRKVCDNDMDFNTIGYAVGDYGDNYYPELPCPPPLP